MSNTTTNNDQSRVWMITGCSTGLGRALALAVLERGERAVVTARDAEKVREIVDQFPERALAVALDVNDPESVRGAVKSAMERFGAINVLVNNAGYGLFGAVEEVSDGEIRQQFGTNFFGLLDLTRAVLPHMRAARSGHVLNVSSLGGFRGFAGVGIYNASKFAVEGLSEALAQEVKPLGISVTIVEPGSFRTDWGGRSLAEAERSIDDYAPVVGAFREGLAKRNGVQRGDPARGALAIIAAVDSDTPPMRLVIGPDALIGMRMKLDSVAKELDDWESVTTSTDFPDADTSVVPALAASRKS